tara:strand:+ start:46955 stop:49051 length:2097 start_codon:yes stop_codon:yes gene_type:complete
MRNYISFLFVFLFSVSAFAGKLEKGFEALLEKDYFKAKEYFEKTLEKEPAGSAFGLSKIYSAEKSPFFNVDTAFKFILICDEAFKITSDKELVDLTGLNVTAASIRRQRVVLAVYFFERANELNTVEGYQAYVDEHPNGDDVEEAQKMRNHLAFKNAMEVNTSEVYAQYMEKYPKALDFEAAKKKFQLVEYQKLTKEGDAASYQQFIINRPNNPYTEEAQNVVYDLYTKSGKPEAYEKFIKENPNNKHLAEAWKYLFKYKTSKYTPAAISEFIIDYPDYPEYESLKEDLLLSNTTFIPARKGNVWGYVDTNGVWKIKPKFNWVSSFSEGKALVGFFGMAVFIDKHGVVDRHMFEDARSFSNNLAVVESGGKMGVMNYLGDTIVPIMYDEIGAYSQGLIYAGLNGKFGYFDENGIEKIPFIYESAFDFKNNKGIVKKDGFYGIVNETGELLLPTIYEWLIPDSNQCVAKYGDKYGMLSFSGDTLMPFDYDAISAFSSKRAIAVIGDKYQYINEKGKVAINEKFDFNETTLNYSAFKNGYARIKSKGKAGIIDVNGKRVYPAIFADVGYYDLDLTPINKTGLWGFANVDIKLTIPYKYTYAYNFEQGFAVVENDSSKALINTNDEIIIPFGYDKIELLDANFVLVEKGGLNGILNLLNDTIVPVNYTGLNRDVEGVITFEKDNKSEIFWLNTGTVIYKEE